MSPNKKRKLDKPPVASQLSAVAARRALQTKAQASVHQNGNIQPKNQAQPAPSGFSALKSVESAPESAIIDEDSMNTRCESGLSLLNSLSPLLGKLWNDDSWSLGPEFKSLIKKPRSSTYQIVRSDFNIQEYKLNPISQLFSTTDGSQKAYLQPLVSAPEWNASLSKSAGVAILDLDPGQPEFSPPGQLSLVHLQEPNFGPPYSHPTTGNKSRILRSHAIGSLSPSSNPTLYMACVSDLVAHYKNLLSTLPSCPLILNTPGWVLGSGLEILVDLISKARPTAIIYMSDEGPFEVVATLREAAKSTPVYTLPSQVSEYTTRTAVHLRTMQTMSYFHLNPDTRMGLSWNNNPLSSIPPWEIRYSGENAGILGIICYGEQPPANLLADTINGSLVAVVVLEDLAAIPGWESQDQVEPRGEGPLHQSSPELSDENFISFNDSPDLDTSNEDNLENPIIAKPLIVQTTIEGLPYFNPQNDITLNPRYSHMIGLALVRGIDVPRKRLQILTSIQASVIDEVNKAGKKIVFVHGKLDTPGWAYTEELHQKSMIEKEKKRTGGEKMDVDDNDEDGEDVGMNEVEDSRVHGEGFQDAPWVEKLEGSQGRGLGARVWRIPTSQIICVETTFSGKLLV
ncbi:hypothetical protein G7Y89_g9176 [Cudoniella acicularis]|uniref:Polynucleotide 5'-hydroxyl-kinase GRC3 n=1 Tax=Cudoniella acicularis TaxID=354080 RepID=A0A8H4RG38_9HELO|nr:hypothetical protein G7Y89_g9176 [Cudoniella acicularis]